LIIRLIIQTIRRDPSGSDQIDDPSNVSRPDPSGTDQIDAEHQATELALMGPGGTEGGDGLQAVAFLDLSGVAQLHVGLLLWWVAAGDGPAAFQLGVQLGPEQDGGVG
jgi:hypothetical protein